jgi:hypothetical protein
LIIGPIKNNISKIKQDNSWRKSWDIIVAGRFGSHHKQAYQKHVHGEIEHVRKENTKHVNYFDLLLYDRSSGTAAFFSMYVPRPLLFAVSPAVFKKGESTTATLYFLDEGREFKFEFKRPDGSTHLSWHSRASGGMRDEYTFTVANDDHFPTGNWKVQFYVKDGDMYKIEHTKNIYVITEDGTNAGNT